MSGTGHEVVIVGASAAGLRCASRLARLRPDWSLTVVEAEDSFSFAACGLPYVLSGDISDLEALHRTADGTTRDAGYFSHVKGFEILAGWRAVAIDTESRELQIQGTDGRSRTLSYDDLVLATGSRPRRLPDQPDHPRVVTFHTAADVPPLHQGLAGGKIGRAIIIGAGFLGCELAEAFGSLWGAEVTLLEAGPTPLPALLDPEVGALVGQALLENDVDLRLNVVVESIEPANDQVEVHLAAGDAVAGDVVVVAIGVEPVVELAAAAGISLGTTGAIVVDEKLSTSVAGVWAVGDVAEMRHAVTGEPVWVPLGSLANRQGRTLANILAGAEDRFAAVVGSSAIKVFDLNVAACGVTRKAAPNCGEAVRSVWISAHDRADYWPEAAEIAVQLTFGSESRRVLGVQAAGEGEVAKRIDVATQLILRKADLADFAAIEHAYSPPFAPALEPLAVAAMVAENSEDGLRSCGPTAELEGFRVLDVRHAEEIEARPLAHPEVTCLPLDSLRERLKEIEPAQWMVICERGPRAAEAARVLKGCGVEAVFLGGGMRWRHLAGLAGC